MKRSSPSHPPRAREAALAVVELACVSLELPFLRWQKEVNLGMAEMVWNMHSAGPNGVLASGWSAEFDDLVERLKAVRAARWPDQRVLVFNLAVRYEGGEMVYTFDLTWDEGDTFTPCEIVWSPQVGLAN